MKFTLSLLALVAGIAQASAEFVAYDPNYDSNSGISIEDFACYDYLSDDLGYSSATFTNFIELTPGVYYGASPYADCGACYQLSSNTASIKMLTVDNGREFIIGLGPFNVLTQGQGEAFGFLNVDVQALDISECIPEPILAPSPGEPTAAAY